MRLIRLAAALALAFLPCSLPARADDAPGPQAPRCVDGGAALRGLMGRYHETPTWRGALPGGYAAVLTARPDGASWTVMIVRPDGMACPVMAGEQSEFALRSMPPAKQPPTAAPK